VERLSRRESYFKVEFVKGEKEIFICCMQILPEGDRYYFASAERAQPDSQYQNEILNQ
jgi:hypothetical protein